MIKMMKNGHSLFRSLFIVILLGGLACLLATLLYGDAEITESELREMQVKAEEAYNKVYFSKVKEGVRGEVEVSELLKQLKEDGVNFYKLSSYNFEIKDKKVIVTPSRGEVVKDDEVKNKESK